MNRFKDASALVSTILANPQMLKVKPSLSLFLLRYMSRFHAKNVGGALILHSHLPPMNSKAYTRFVNEHLLRRVDGPSHAQIGLTNACPQKCAYCYNRERTGQVMEKETIKQLIQDLKRMGVFWLGFTGGEPLLNKNIVEITESVGEDCSVKLFTTGCTLTYEKASDLKKAGLFSVSVSLDHWRKDEHDRARGYEGAFKTALKAIDIFKHVDGIHVGVSAVLSKQMLKTDQVEEFLEFLMKLGVHEAWLSETKPSVQDFWNDDLIIREEEHQKLIRLQDKYNKRGGITVNYLGHFESRNNFGCSAGVKMVYVDAFGEVSPCVFTPITFGNVRDNSIQEIYGEMKKRFPTEDQCFINKNYQLLKKYYSGQFPVSKNDTLKMLDEISFGPLPRFYQLYYP
jgi:MoaA/NifB/PqqE/SkfB family radical SAM enzyme